MTKLNKALMATTAIVVASGLTLPASAQNADPSAAPGVVKSGKKVKLRLYGQISRQFGVVGDGEATTFKTGENDNDGTRMGIDGRGMVTKDISLRTRIEFAIVSGNPGGGSQFENQGGSNDFDIRHTDVILTHKRFGAIWVGRGDSATNGTSEVQLTAGLDAARLGGGVSDNVSKYIFLDKNSSIEPQAVATVDRFFSSFDGAGRQNRIRYDSPTLFGFKASAGWIDKHNVDGALRYGGKIAGTKLKGAVGFCSTSGAVGAGDGACFGDGTDVKGIEQLSGSISFVTPIGIGATFSGARQWLKRSTTAGGIAKGDPLNLNPAIHYTAKWTGLGESTIEYAYQYTEDKTNNGDKGQGHALTYLQNVDSVGGNYFLGFRYMQAETASNDNIDDLWWFGGGFRQQF